MVLYLPKGAVILVNKIITEDYSQPHVVQQEANLDHVLDSLSRYANSIDDEEEKLLRKAAYLTFNMAYTAHVFADGNKRTTFLFLNSFLFINGYVLKDTLLPVQDEQQAKLADFMREVAAGKKSINAIYDWLKTNVVKRNSPP